jgi:hypothetical protein
MLKILPDDVRPNVNDWPESVEQQQKAQQQKRQPADD